MVGKRLELVEWKQKSGRSECVQRRFVDSTCFFSSDLDLEKVMSPEEKQKLFEAIGYAGEDTSTTTYPEEVRRSSRERTASKLLRFQFVDIDVGVRLNMLDVNIWSKVNPLDDQ